MFGALMGLDEVLARTELTKTDLVGRLASGEFPPNKLRLGRLFWDRAEVDTWIKANKPVMRRTCLYRHFDADGRLLYVGISLSAIERLQGHRDRSPWFEEIASVSVEWFPTRMAARVAELAAIRAEKPLHNKAGAKA